MWFGDNIPATVAIEELASRGSSATHRNYSALIRMLMEFLSTPRHVVWQYREIPNKRGLVDCWFAVRWIGFFPQRVTVGKTRKSVHGLWRIPMPAAFDLTMGFDTKSALAQAYKHTSLDWLLWATQPSTTKLVIEYRDDDDEWVLAKDPWALAFDAQQQFLNTRVSVLEEVYK